MKQAALLVLLAFPAAAQDVYRTVTLDEVTWTGEDKPRFARSLIAREVRGWPQPQVRTKEAEAWLGLPFVSAWGDAALRVGDLEVSVKGEPGETVRCEFWLRGPKQDLVRYPFEVTLEEASDDGSDDGMGDFLENRYLAYSWRHALDLPGAAWFRHQKERTAAELEDLGREVPEFKANDLRDVRGKKHDIDRTFDLFSGGRALAENLALDEVIEGGGDEVGTIRVTDLEGITVPEIEWEELLVDPKRSLDPLAAFVPADQHAIYFPSFPSLVRVLDELRAEGAVVLELMDGSSEDAGTQARYEKQLCLPLDQVARVLAGTLVKRVAVTGGDPYFRTGTDVAVLFESPNPDALLDAIHLRQFKAVEGIEGAQVVSGQLASLAYSGVHTPDRAICSYAARLGDVVVVANSMASLARLEEVHSGQAEAMSVLPEYHWFRERYRRGEREDAFVMVTDAAIRRWASPQWRIANSRRVRAAAWMADRQAARIHDRSLGRVDHVDLPVRSQTYGTPAFLTPIAELEVDYVNEKEAEGYRRFRGRYMALWREVFDPAGLRIIVEEDTLDLDLTVRPLAIRSNYRELIELTEGATLAPTAGDAHEGTALHFAMALGRESDLFEDIEDFLTDGVFKDAADPLAWLGNDVSIWIENDAEFWQEAMGAEDPQDFLQYNLYRLPIAMRLPSNNPLRLAAFLTGLRSFVEGSAPGLVDFERRNHNDRGYIAIVPEGLEDWVQQPLAVYYASLSDAWVMSFREDVIHKAMDRHAAKQTSDREWIGESASLRLSEGFPQMIGALWGESWRKQRRLLSWRAQPILDEWRSRFPDIDPVEFHAAEFGVRLRGPSGGTYVLDEEWNTTTCTAFGHPGNPLPGPLVPPAIESLSEVELGVAFEEGDGLRARVRLKR